MSENSLTPATVDDIAPARTELIEFLQPSRCELSMSNANNVVAYTPRPGSGEHTEADLCSEMSHDEIFKQLEKLSRVMLQARGFAGRESNPHGGRKWSPSTWIPRGKSSNREAQDKGCLRRSHENAISSASDVRERGRSHSKLSWERIMLNTSIVGGIEDWVKRLDVPETPDNRIKLIYASICAERKKRELYDQIHESILQTDSEIRTIMVQIQINDALDKLQLIKYSVETIEDVLIRLSRNSLEPRERDSLIEKLAATVHREAVNELLRLAYARNLVLVSMGVLLGSDFKWYAIEVLKTWLSDIVHEELNPCPSEKKLLLNKIIERGTKTESEWLEKEFLAALANYSESQHSSGTGSEIEKFKWCMRAKSIIGELFAKTRGSSCTRRTELV